MPNWRFAVVAALLAVGCTPPEEARDGATVTDGDDVAAGEELPNLFGIDARGFRRPLPFGGEEGLVNTNPPITPSWPALQEGIERFAIRYGSETERIVFDPSKSRVYAPGWFTIAGNEQEVELRRRGDSARFHPKSSWKVKLPDGQTYRGQRRFNFLAEWLDGGILSDMFSYPLFEGFGVIAPRTRYVLLHVNGRHEGLFVEAQQVDKHFLRFHRIDEDASIYRCGSKDCELKITPPAHYQKPFAKKTNEELPNDDLEKFLWEISRTPEGEFEAWASRTLDLDPLLRTLALYAVIGMYGIDDSGSYLIHDFRRDKWLFVPWDLNNARLLLYRGTSPTSGPRVTRPIPVYTAYDSEMIRTYEHKQQKYGGAHLPWNVLFTRLWDRPVFRHRILDYTEELMATLFSEAEAHARIDAQYRLIASELRRDPYVSQSDAARAPKYLKDFVTGRNAFLRTELPKARRHGEGGVVINALGMPGSGRTDERGEADGWIELYNREDQPVDVGGMVLTNVLRQQFKYRLPSGLVVPPKGTLVLWADGQTGQGRAHLPFTLDATGGELGLFDGRSMTGVLDLTFYAPMSNGQVYARSPDGSETWRFRSPGQ
ncbi:MAG: CotH kinase family protein [Myxococcales bacterium]